MDWISPGGMRYRAPYGANNGDVIDLSKSNFLLTISLLQTDDSLTTIIMITIMTMTIMAMTSVMKVIMMKMMVMTTTMITDDSD